MTFCNVFFHSVYYVFRACMWLVYYKNYGAMFCQGRGKTKTFLCFSVEWCVSFSFVYGVLRFLAFRKQPEQLETWPHWLLKSCYLKLRLYTWTPLFQTNVRSLGFAPFFKNVLLCLMWTWLFQVSCLFELICFQWTWFYPCQPPF